MPAAPPENTLKPLSTRAFVPRWHITILPAAALPDASLVWHSTSSPGMLWASITGVAVEMPSVIVTPVTSNVAPPSAVRWRVDVKKRLEVEAPTVVTHGPPCSTVPAVGPLLPPDALTEIPAL